MRNQKCKDGFGCVRTMREIGISAKWQKKAREELADWCDAHR